MNFGCSCFYREYQAKDYKIQIRFGFGRDSPHYIVTDIEDLPFDLQQDVKNALSFSALETILFYILVTPVIEKRKCTLSIAEIHKCFRQQKLLQDDKVSTEMEKLYLETIESLSQKHICIMTSPFFKVKYGLNNINIATTLFIFTIQHVNNNINVEYHFSNWVNILKLSKRFSNDILPIDFFHTSAKDIVKFKIAVYFANLFFTNRRKKQNYFNLKLTSFMNAILYFSSNGTTNGSTYLNKMDESISNKTTILRRFVNSIVKVLELFKQSNKIQDFKIFIDKNKKLSITDKSFLKHISVKNFETVYFQINFKSESIKNIKNDIK